MEGTLSHKSSVTSGVPQGSVLGPLEFALYLESLLTRLSTVCSSCSIYGYADDLKIVSSDKNELQHALHVVQQWATVWRLTIQPTKSKYNCFGRNYKTKATTTNEFYLSNTLIPHKTVVKDLGVLTTHNLKWSAKFKRSHSKLLDLPLLC